MKRNSTKNHLYRKKIYVKEKTTTEKIYTKNYMKN